MYLSLIPDMSLLISNGHYEFNVMNLMIFSITYIAVGSMQFNNILLISLLKSHLYRLYNICMNLTFHIDRKLHFDFTLICCMHVPRN